MVLRVRVCQSVGFFFPLKDAAAQLPISALALEGSFFFLFFFFPVNASGIESSPALWFPRVGPYVSKQRQCCTISAVHLRSRLRPPLGSEGLEGKLMVGLKERGRRVTTKGVCKATAAEGSCAKKRRSLRIMVANSGNKLKIEFQFRFRVL